MGRPCHSDQQIGLGKAVVDADASCDQTFDGLDRFVEHRLFVFVHLDFDDALDATGTNDRGHTNVEPVQTIGTVNMGRARQ